MYRDFTNSAEPIRLERYRTARVATGWSGQRLRSAVGHLMVNVGKRLMEGRIAPTTTEGASV